MEQGSKPGTETRPRWLVAEDDPPPADNHHVWAPRPVGRSILWTPIGEHRNAPAGPYEVFVKQRAIEAMYRHLWGADHADEPFGYLFGYLCEDRESQRRYVIISSAIASAYPLHENESKQIAPEAVRALRQEVGKNDGVLAGWYRRHREGPVRLTDEDEATHREHFGEPWQVAFLLVTDAERPDGGCLQPRTHGVTAHTPLPFYELAGAASLLARGIRRTRIDWENVATETHVLVEPLPRPEVQPAAAESIAAEVAEAQPVSTDPPDVEADESVFELDHLNPPAALDLAPESEAHFELLSGSAVEAVDRPGVAVEESEAEAVEATEPESELVQEAAELEVEVEPEPTRETEPPAGLMIEPLTRPYPRSELEFAPIEQEPTEPLGEVVAEAEPVAEAELASEPEAGLEDEPETHVESDIEAEIESALEPEPTEPVDETEIEAEAEPEPAEEVMVAPPAAVQWVEPAPNLRPRPAPPPLSEVVPRPEPETSAETVVSPAPEPQEDKPQRSPHWNGAIESLLVLIAVGSIVVGAWPLPGGSRTATEDLPSFATALAGFVLPAAAVPSAGLEVFDDSDPLAPLGREVRVAVGRFSAVSDMFATRRLTCEPLREAYVEVNAAWSAYSGAIARSGSERSESGANRDEAVAQEVQDAETNFTSSGCERP